MAGIAVNRLGVTTKEFYMMSPVELHEALQDYHQQEEQKLKIVVQATYEAARLSAFLSIKYNPQIKDNFRKKLKIQQLCEFGWEKEQKKEEQDLEKMKQALIAIHVDNYMRRRRQGNKSKIRQKIARISGGK